MPIRSRLLTLFSGIWLAALFGGGCFAPARRPLDEELVACPLNERANTVLRSVIERCASSDGAWAHDMGPGCPRIWATRFGLATGLRRQRDDLIELGRVTAERESSDVTGLILGAVFGEVDRESAAASGVPALLISGILDGDGSDYQKFRLVFSRAVEELDFASLGENQRTGATVLFAELARVEPDESGEWLERARELLETIRAPKLVAFARAAIARVTGREEDIDAAREAIESAAPALVVKDGRLVSEPPAVFVLSHELALVNALADMAQLGGKFMDRARAEALLAFVFSEALLEDGVLRHDGRRDGFRSKDYCSGCNLNALFLVDRLYGDTWKIDALPELPERPDPWLEKRTSTEALAPLYPDQKGSFGFLDFGVSFGYSVLPADDSYPHGALRLDFRLNDNTQDCRFESGEDMIVPLDESDRARFTPGARELVEGAHDPEITSFTFEIGRSRKNARMIKLAVTRLEEVGD